MERKVPRNNQTVVVHFAPVAQHRGKQLCWPGRLSPWLGLSDPCMLVCFPAEKIDVEKFLGTTQIDWSVVRLTACLRGYFPFCQELHDLHWWSA